MCPPRRAMNSLRNASAPTFWGLSVAAFETTEIRRGEAVAAWPARVSTTAEQRTENVRNAPAPGVDRCRSSPQMLIYRLASRLAGGLRAQAPVAAPKPVV